MSKPVQDQTEFKKTHCWCPLSHSGKIFGINEHVMQLKKMHHNIDKSKILILLERVQDTKKLAATCKEKHRAYINASP